jgi:hypothetical protein
MLYWALCGYLLAFIVNNLADTVAVYFFGWGPVYAWVYSLTSVPIFLAIAWVCHESLHARKLRVRAVTLGFLLALTIGHLAYVGIVRPVDAYDWITLTEGTLLFWAGTMIGASAAYAERSDVALCLAFLWLAQALFSFGYVLHFDWLWWQKANLWLPETICIVGFSLLGYRLRCQPRATHQPAHLL